MKNVSGGVACTAMLLLFASPAQAALLQLECSFKEEMAKVQPDGSKFKDFKLNFSLDTETRKGSLVDDKGTIYDLSTRFTVDKIVSIRTKFLSSDPESTKFIYRYDISRIDGSFMKFFKIVKNPSF